MVPGCCRFAGIKKARLGGIEPPHLPPEGSALSTELQTCITYIPEKKASLWNALIMLTHIPEKVKNKFFDFLEIHFLRPGPEWHGTEKYRKGL